ncbi:hypothetical protein FRUB_07653 [Fimbriiglobus ruber]|uniref:Uncharacterized protein n=2 Tax=Fimbriiglobus ruber TaxID=1908690 RepID=A0A225DC20_9BACT|nr:hypothetical protein FRUB_07653 [Fimbriiglobus ruber]
MSAVGVLLLAGLVAFFGIGSGITAEEIGDESITLKGVSEEFAAAVNTGYRTPRVASTGGIELATAKFFRT